MNSKILIAPTFKPIPQSTSANVEENIVHWLNTNNHYAINTFCRPCGIGDLPHKHGYRFINMDDLDETIITKQIIKGIEFNITWFRRLHAADHFCPLWYSEWYIKCTLSHGNVSFEFRSDNDLNNKIKLIKSNKTEIQ